jgi:CyaY protein
MINDKDFAKEVTRIINLIAKTIEDNDITGDILNITTQSGIFVLNKQASVKEIWLSSPVSGPYHFLHDGKSWKSKSGKELFSVLSKDLDIQIKDLL